MYWYRLGALWGNARASGWKGEAKRRASHLIISKLVTAPHTFMQKRPSSVACAPWIIYSGGWPLAKMDLEFAIKVHSSISPKRIIALLLKSSKAVAFTLRPQNAKTFVRLSGPCRGGTGDRRKMVEKTRTRNSCDECDVHPPVCETYNKLD